MFKKKKKGLEGMEKILWMGGVFDRAGELI